MYKTIALLTDFGLKDHYAGVVKARILKEAQNLSDIHFIDITHEIPPQDIKKACILLYFSYKYFPENTIFLVVVDPGVGTQRKAIIIETEKYLFVGPDNGVFSLIYQENPNFKAWEIDIRKVLKPPFSTTFHGRDLFAPAIAYILKGTPISEIASLLDKKNLIKLDFSLPEKTSDGYRLSIWYVDNFGNLITNFHQDMVEKPFEVIVNGKSVRFVKSYGYAEKGEIIALFGSEGLLEIAVREGSAVKLLNNPKIEIKWK